MRAALGPRPGIATRVESFDDRLTRIDFFRAGRIAAAAGVTLSGHVVQFVNYAKLPVPYGNWIAYEPGVVIGLSALFVLMTAVWPWRRMRNLDVVASLGLVGAAMLFAHRYLDSSLHRRGRRALLPAQPLRCGGTRVDPIVAR